MMRTMLMTLLAVGLAATAQAATVTLSLDVDQNAKTWAALAQLDTDVDNNGLASISVDVVGHGGVTVNSSKCEMPQGFTAGFQPWGFKFLRFDQAVPPDIPGIGVGASLDTISWPRTTLFVTDYAFLPGSKANANPADGPPLVEWFVPALIASGTYTGESGMLTINLTQDALAGVLKKGFNYGDPPGQGDVEPAQVIPGEAIIIPEPGTLALLLLGGLGLLVFQLRRK